MSRAPRDRGLMYQIRGSMNCRYCKSDCKKDGFQKNGTQRYKCKHCGKKQQGEYCYNAYDISTNAYIKTFVCEGVGIRSIARILNISTTTLFSRIISIAKSINQPPVSTGQVYEVDEIKSFVKRKDKHIWIVYALNRVTKEIVAFSVGPRTNVTLGKVIKTLLLSGAKRIFTDRWRGYQSLIDEKTHSVANRGTNHIERHNLTLRTHLKRLTRRTICYSRSIAILSAILRIYFWG